MAAKPTGVRLADGDIRRPSASIRLLISACDIPSGRCSSEAFRRLHCMSCPLAGKAEMTMLDVARMNHRCALPKRSFNAAPAMYASCFAENSQSCRLIVENAYVLPINAIASPRNETPTREIHGRQLLVLIPHHNY